MSRQQAGNNSRVVNLLLDRLDRITALELDADVLDGIPSHRIARLRRQGERYYANGMRDLPEHRRFAILAVCGIEWRSEISDAIVETHDRIVGKLYRSAERARDDQLNGQRELIQKALHSFAEIDASIMAALEAGESLDASIEQLCGWTAFGDLVDDAVRVNAKVSADALDFVDSGYYRFRRYAPRLLDTLSIDGARSAEPLLPAVKALRELNQSGNRGIPNNAPTAFARPKWRKRLRGNPDRRTWETAILFSIRDAFRAGLNKGEAHHALKRAISFNRRGEIRDRSSEGQHYRVAGMNLIAAIVIY